MGDIDEIYHKYFEFKEYTPEERLAKVRQWAKANLTDSEKIFSSLESYPEIDTLDSETKVGLYKRILRPIRKSKKPLSRWEAKDDWAVKYGNYRKLKKFLNQLEVDKYAECQCKLIRAFNNISELISIYRPSLRYDSSTEAPITYTFECVPDLGKFPPTDQLIDLVVYLFSSVLGGMDKVPSKEELKSFPAIKFSWCDDTSEDDIKWREEDLAKITDINQPIWWYIDHWCPINALTMFYIYSRLYPGKLFYYATIDFGNHIFIADGAGIAYEPYYCTNSLPIAGKVTYCYPISRETIEMIVQDINYNYTLEIDPEKIKTFLFA